MPLIEFEALRIPVLCNPPVRGHRSTLGFIIPSRRKKTPPLHAGHASTRRLSQLLALAIDCSGRPFPIRFRSPQLLFRERIYQCARTQVQQQNHAFPLGSTAPCPVDGVVIHIDPSSVAACLPASLLKLNPRRLACPEHLGGATFASSEGFLSLRFFSCSRRKPQSSPQDRPDGCVASPTVAPWDTSSKPKHLSHRGAPDIVG